MCKTSPELMQMEPAQNHPILKARKLSWLMHQMSNFEN